MRNKRFLFCICFFSSMLGGTVSTLMAVYLPAALKDLFLHSGTISSDDIGASISAIFIFGWMAGGIVWGILCDTIGRRRSFIYATAGYGLFTLLTAIAPSWQFVLISRLLSGFGIGGVLVITTMLVSESYREGRRAVLLGILSISIPLGIFSAGLINYLVHNWRLAFAVGVIPMILAALAARYLREQGREEVRESAGHRAAVDLPGLFSGPNGKNILIGSLIFGAALIGLWAAFSWLPSWIQSLIPGADGQKERGIAMMLMGTGGLAGGFVSGWIVNAINVKRTLLACFGICFVLSFLLFKVSDRLTPAVFLQIGIISIFFGVSQGALSVYIPDLFPSSVSATGTGFCFNLGRLFTAIAVFFVGSLVDLLGGYGNAIFCFSFVFLIGLFLTLFTKAARRPPRTDPSFSPSTTP
ncbi:MAG: MFS transporter [Bacteroidota bacterium]|nr:MFS transporter [Bacteroidota bacterium]